MSYDTVLIADVYQRLKDAERNHYEVDVEREAEGLSMLIRPLGHRHRRMAIVPDDNSKALDAYRRAGFSIRPMNGNRPAELIAYISEESHNLRTAPPDHLIVVSTDPTFELLCTAMTSQTKISIWAPTTNVPPQFTHPNYDFRHLEELLPGTKIKIATVVVYLDYENLHIGLERIGTVPDPKTIIEAVRTLTADLGNIADIKAYADWFELSKGKSQDIQRELALMGVKTHYQVGVHGKNSADMAMANDIRTTIDRNPNASDAVDTVVLGTRDSDFSTIVETAQGRGKKVIILALRNGLSRKLAQRAEVRYLDELLSAHGQNHRTAKATDEQFAQVVRTIAYLNQNGWRWAYIDKLAAAVTTNGNGIRQLLQAKDAGLYKPGRPQCTQTLQLNLDHPDAFKAWWIWSRIDYCLKKKGMPYVDTSFLARGMQMDEKCQEFGIGQTWPDAKKELERVAATGFIMKKSQKHPKDPDKWIDTWWPANNGTEEQPLKEKRDPSQSPGASNSVQKPRDSSAEDGPEEETTQAGDLVSHHDAGSAAGNDDNSQPKMRTFV